MSERQVVINEKSEEVFVIVCGARTEPEGKECPRSVDGKCAKGHRLAGMTYGLGSGYGGFGVYDYCRTCDEVYDWSPSGREGRP